MMYSKDKPGPAHDLSELHGDPWQLGPISDAPDPAAVNSDLRQYDHYLDNATMGAGVEPGSPGWEPTRQAIEDQHVIGPQHGEYPRHGDPLPTSAREFMANSPQSARDEITEQSAAADELLADYAAIYGREWANDSAGLQAAIGHVSRQLHRDGLLVGKYITEHREDYLRDVYYAHSAGYGRPDLPAYAGGDSGRTAGIGSGSGGEQYHPNDSDQSGMVGEIRALQKARGWTP
jgi:hypothetical protein